jgi:hypothetical protein
MPNLRFAIMLCFLSGLIACASIPAPSAAKADFGGEWSVKWCDKADPQADCGGFYVSLVQEGDRLCGSYNGARVRLSQIDDGGSRAIRGVVVGDTAVLTIESGRSGAIYLVSADVLGDRMRWKMRDTVREADQDIDIIATDDELERRPLESERSERHADTVAACSAVNGLVSRALSERTIVYLPGSDCELNFHVDMSLWGNITKIYFGRALGEKLA